MQIINGFMRLLTPTSYNIASRISAYGCGEYSFAVAAHLNDVYGRTSEESAINTAHLLDNEITLATFTDDGYIESKCTNTGCTYESTETIPAISSVALSETAYKYNGTVRNPSLIVKDREDKELTEGKDYTVSIPDGRKDIGTYTYNVEFKGRYSGSKDVSFTIGAGSISDYSAKLSQTSYTYDGSAKKPTVTIDGLTEGTDFTVAYSGNVNAGTAAATITGKGNYTGTITKNFTIEGRSIAGYSAKLAYTSYTYSGSAKKPKVTVTGLTSGTDYTVEYSNNINVGTATAVITGIGNYSGTITKTYTIKAKSISGKTPTLTAASFAYTGKALKPAVTISGLKSGSDFTAKYANNTKVGKATITITGKGNYTGTLTKTFKVVPKQAAIKSLISGKKKLTVKMTAKPSSKAGSTYQIAYKKKGTSTWKYTTTTSGSKTIKSLKKGKTYYLKVRAYKTVNKVKYYGEWSKTKLSKKVK